MQLGTAYLELAPSTRGLAPAIRKELGEVERESRRSGDRAGAEYGEGFASKAGGIVSRIWDGVFVGIGIKAFDTIAGAVGGIFQRAIGGGFDRLMNIEQAEIKIRTLGLDVESVMSDVNAAVDGTKFAISDAADMAATLGAAGVEAGDDMQKWLERTADAAQFTNREFGDIQLIIGRIVAEGRVTGETFNQIPLAAAALADHLGISQQEVRKLASEGKISAEDFGAAMDSMIGGASKNAGDSFLSMRDNILTAVSASGAAIMEPIIDAAMPMMAVGLDLAKGFRDNVAKPLGESMAGWLEGVAPKVQAWLEGLPAAFEVASDRIGVVTGAVKGAWDLIVGGDFTGGLFGLEEDSPIIDTILNIRDSVLELVDGIRTGLVPVFEAVSGYVTRVLIPTWSNIAGIVLDTVGPAFSTIVSVVRDNVLPILQNFVGFFTDRIMPVISRVVDDVILPAFRDVSDFVVEKFLPAFKSFTDYISDNVAPVVMDFADRVLIPAFEGIAAIVKWAWDEVIYPALNSLWDFITNTVAPVVEWLWREIFAPAFEGMGDIVDWFGGKWRDTWNSIQETAARPVNFVIETVWNNGLRKVLNYVVEAFGGTAMAPVPTVSWGSSFGGSRGSSGGRGAVSRFAEGGYTGPGDKWDPAGIVHRGEYVLTKSEVESAGGPSAIERWKDSILHGYATGGLVGSGSARTTFRGHTFTRLFASVLQAAEALSGSRFNISQGGFRPTTSYSGTSHRGDAVDITSPITTAVITALRASGVAAWDRTGKGNWRPHIHGVPLPGYGFAGGSAIWQAQDYLRGGDGLGGRDNGPRVNAQGGPTFFSGLMEIPDILKNVISGLKDLSGGPWAKMLREGFTGMVDKVGDWVWDKLGDLGSGIRDVVFDAAGKAGEWIGNLIPGRGYATGTSSAAPGWAWAGERGPELIRFNGGERVLSHEDSVQAISSGPSQHDITALVATLGALVNEMSGIRSDLRFARVGHYMDGGS